MFLARVDAARGLRWSAYDPPVKADEDGAIRIGRERYCDVSLLLW